MLKNSRFLTVVLMLIFIGKISAQDSSIINATPPSSPKEIIIKYGIASYYADKFNGRKTATGHIYNPAKLTAACNILPLGTWVKVTNLRNDRSVIVQVNDRLHYKNKRLIDLTKSAAQKLDFTGRGITRVKVEVLGTLNQKNKGMHKPKNKRTPGPKDKK